MRVIIIVKNGITFILSHHITSIVIYIVLMYSIECNDELIRLMFE